MAGIIHPYYTVALAPAIGALVGIGAVTAWRLRAAWHGRVLLASGVAVTTLWSAELLGRAPSWHPLLRVAVLVAGLGAAAALAAGPRLTALAGRARGKVALALVPALVALLAILAGSAAYTLATVTTAHTGAIPSAGPAVALSGGPGGLGGLGAGGPGGAGQRGLPGGTRGTGGTGGTGGAGGQGFPGAPGGQPPAGTAGGQRPASAGQAPAARGQGNPGGGLGGNTQVSSKLVNLLKQDAGRYRWAAATVGTQSAAPLQLATRQPMLAIGGFNGSDPAPTLAQFKRLVSAGQIHYFVGANASSFGGGTGSAAQITSWVAAHFTSQTVGGVTVYDLAR